MQFFRTGLHWDISSVPGTRHTGLTLCPHLGGWEGLGSRDSRAADCCCASRGLATSWPPLAAGTVPSPGLCVSAPEPHSSKALPAEPSTEAGRGTTTTGK